jgi:hypothetical protein
VSYEDFCHLYVVDSYLLILVGAKDVKVISNFDCKFNFFYQNNDHISIKPLTPWSGLLIDSTNYHSKSARLHHQTTIQDCCNKGDNSLDVEQCMYD